MTPTVRSRLQTSVALAAVLAQLAASAGPASAFWRLLRRQGDAKMFQQILQGRPQPATASRPPSPWRAITRASPTSSPSWSRCRPSSRKARSASSKTRTDRSSRCLHGAAAGPNISTAIPARRCLASPLMAHSAQTVLPAPLPSRAYKGVTVEARYDVAEYERFDPLSRGKAMA